MPFKGVINGQEDTVIAKVNVTDSSIVLDSLVFKTSAGAKIDAKRITGSNDFELTVKGMQSNAVEEVQASIKQGKKYKVAGAFKLVHMGTHSVELRLVPTSSSIKLDDIAKEIKAIYEKVGVTVNIGIKPEFDISAYLENNQLPTIKDDKLSTYSDAQQRLFKGYQNTTSLDKAYYLFVTDKASSTGQSGYMRLNGQYGFVFDALKDKQETARVAAHEFGHGSYRLEHPFVEYKKDLKEGATNSLMDYQTKSTEFIYTNWRQINDPKLKLYTFQGQSEGEFSNYVLTPNYDIVQISGTETIISSKNCKGILGNSQGVLYSFKLNGEYYCWDISKTGDNRYYSGSKKLENFNTVKQVLDDATISLYFDMDKACPEPSYKINVKYSEIKKSLTQQGLNQFIEAHRSDSRKITVNCDSSQDSYDSLNSLGKDVYDKNKGSIPTEDQDILLEISKLVQDLDVEVYNSFVDKQKHNGTMSWHTTVNKGEYTREKLENTLKEFQRYKAALDKLYNYPFKDAKELVEHVKNNFQVTKGSDYLYVFPSDPKYVRVVLPPFKKMTVERKKQLLDLLHKSTYPMTNEVGNDVNAGTILTTLLLTCDYRSNESFGLVNYIIDKKYLKHFVDDLYGVQYDNFMNSFIDIILFNVKYDDVKLDLVNPNYLKFSDAFLTASNKEKLLSDGVVELRVKKWSPSWSWSEGIKGNAETYEVKSKPLDCIIVEFTKDVELGKNLIFKKGGVYKMPAIMVYDLFWQDTKAARWKSAQITAEVLLTTVGIGEIALAVDAYRASRTVYGTFIAVKALSDIGIGFADIYIQNSDVLSDEDRATWTKIVLCYTAGSISASAIDGAIKALNKKVFKTSEDINELKEALKKEGADVELLYSKLENKDEFRSYLMLDNTLSVNTGKRLEQMGLKQLEKKLESMGGTMRKQFELDFNNISDDVLRNLNKENSELFEAWKKNEN